MSGPDCTCRPKPGACHIYLADGCPVHDTQPEPPRGYSELHPLLGLDGLVWPQRECLRCGAVVADVRTHDLWHGGVDR